MRVTARGWWLEEAGGVQPRPPLAEPLRADVVVLGGGYTGMWAAWHLLDRAPDTEIVLLESGVCGEGPSGRNGGFVDHQVHAPAELREASIGSVRAIGAWCEANDVDAWYEPAGQIIASAAPAQDATVAPDGVLQPLTAAEVAARCASPVLRAGLFNPDAATVQPGRLARGLRRRLIERGVRVFEHTRAIGLHERPGEVRVITTGGTVRAGAAILATGSRAVAARPLRRSLTVTSSHIVLTEPVPDVLEELGWTGGEAITDGRHLVHYFRTTRDGRIAFGWGGGRIVCGARLQPRDDADRALAVRVAADLVRFFPQLAGRRIEHAWGGPIDASPQHLPVVDTLPGGRAHYAFGYTGNGVGPSELCGRILARLALDERDALTRLPLVAPAGRALPPEPLRVAGGAAVRVALDRKERAEEAGQAPSAVARLVARLPDLLGVQIGR